MTGTFSGWTAEHYAAYRRELPGPVVDALVEHFRLDGASRVVDLGSGTGQVVVPLARRVGLVIAVEPEPDMLRRLRDREEAGGNVLAVIGSDRDLPLIGRLAGSSLDLLTVANALHFMDAASVFADAAAMLRPGGGVAVISHGWPLWLAGTGWARAVRAFLEDWLGTRTTSTCGLDEATMRERAGLLSAAGFVDVTVVRQEDTVERTPEYIVGNLYSALSEAQVAPHRRAEFEAGVLSAIERGAGGEPLLERVPILTLTGRTPT